MLCQIHGILESAAKDGGHDLVWGWPLLGLSDPDAIPDAQWSPAEASVIAWHKEAATLETAKKQLMTSTGKATPKAKSEHLFDDDDSLQSQICVAVKQARQVNSAKAQDSGQIETWSRPS